MDGRFSEVCMGTDRPQTHKKLIGDALSMADFIAYMNKTIEKRPK